MLLWLADQYESSGSAKWYNMIEDTAETIRLSKGSLSWSFMVLGFVVIDGIYTIFYSLNNEATSGTLIGAALMCSLGVYSFLSDREVFKIADETCHEIDCKSHEYDSQE